MARYFFSPLSVLFLVLLIVVLILTLPLIFLGIIGSALSKLGFGIWQVILLVFLMIIGSFINIPVTKIKSEPQVIRVPHGRLMNRFYSSPEFSSETVIALNLGGCIIPLLVSLYLIWQSLYIPGWQHVLFSLLIGVFIVALITNVTAKPVPGIGVATPVLIPPLCALICGIVLSWGVPSAAPIIAYISGTIGTLVGADILNLNKMGSVSASVASIGGAGTFDGIFLSGIIAAFLA
ncbi:putative membrane protein [Methanomicrobium sp. W14]|uniref:DUF1614 domain-containing protein n=1 Tax=Methanomicrobium sp. W14 TaxID=2817839 RepID=UPI001AE3DE74|nr:DUF1614 domain-containing protein [Methanomicrobium sp. W14]MBP2133669.1 putative membrane protein [Methanomicrobium sp. W14]